MKGISASTIIAAVGVAVTLIVGVVPIGASYDLNSRGSVPPKSLEAMPGTPVDPLEDLRRAKDQISLSIKSHNSAISNLGIVQTYIRNTGKAPILPSDMIEPLSIHSNSPWKIITVVDSVSGKSGATLTWSKVSDTEFKSAPTLLNPGDYVLTTVYVTKDGQAASVEGASSGQKGPVNATYWSARIANLKEITTSSSIDTEKISKSLGPIYVSIWGIGIFFVLLSFSIFIVSYTILLYYNGIFSLNLHYLVVTFCIVGLLSISAAEAGNSYLLGTSPYVRMPPPNFVNAPPILVNFLTLITLTVTAFRKNRRKAVQNLP